jgi:hypothetical protein
VQTNTPFNPLEVYRCVGIVNDAVNLKARRMAKLRGEEVKQVPGQPPRRHANDLLEKIFDWKTLLKACQVGPVLTLTDLLTFAQRHPLLLEDDFPELEPAETTCAEAIRACLATVQSS